MTALWIDKYRPHTLADLTFHPGVSVLLRVVQLVLDRRGVRLNTHVENALLALQSYVTIAGFLLLPHVGYSLAFLTHETYVGFASLACVLLLFLSQPVGKLRVENAYKLTHAAYNAPKFADDRQKGLIAREYAGVLYYCGRPDKALEVAKVSMQLLKNSPNPKEYETAKDLVVYYNTVLRMSKAIR